MKLYCFQFDIKWEDKSANFSRVRSLAAGAGIEAGSLLILPEMFATGFSMNSRQLAETETNSETLAFLRELARDYQCHVLAGLVLNANERLTNNALLLTPEGAIAADYEKINPFAPAGETLAVSAGQTIVQADVGVAILSPFICYDLRFPELFRAAVPRSEVFAVIANWPEARVEHFITLLRARAIENQAYLIGVNRIGADPNVTYNGQTLVVDPWGKIVATAEDREEVLAAQLDLAALREWRASFSALRDRRDPASLTLKSH
ncbi:MAG: nitrilase-related carbon-nitrogen hydrolase [Verrucomicrobiota bacterium JB023]|nr:nitrilase-related carbon-nitrogen hydrolase [Verrucomicrobiota bacterium JB023]